MHNSLLPNNSCNLFVGLTHSKVLPTSFSSAFLGHSAHTAAPAAGVTAPPTPSMHRARSQSISSTDAREVASQDAKLRRFQHGLLLRRLQIAKGTLQFNLVRLRSEFSSLYGTNKDIAKDSGRVTNPKPRGPSLSKRGT